MNHCLARIALCVAILTAACPGLIANSQDSAGTASITIEVRDPTGDRIPGAQIRIVPLPLNLVPNQTTDTTGTVSVKLPPGSYTVNATSPGFRTATKRIDVQQGAELTFELVLDVAVSTDPIVVEQLLTTERAPPGDLIIPCSQRDLSAALPSTDPVYGDAAELARTLESLGLDVRCTLASKMRRIFAGQRGAALYRTSSGDFDALFLPPSENFDGLEIVERQEPGRYSYSFSGAPRSKVRINGSKPSYFIKKKNVLFYVGGDDRLAAILRSKLND